MTASMPFTYGGSSRYLENCVQVSSRIAGSPILRYLSIDAMPKALSLRKRSTPREYAFTKRFMTSAFALMYSVVAAIATDG